MRFLLCILLLLTAAMHTMAQESPARPKNNANLTVVMDENLILPMADTVRAYAKESNTPLTTVIRNEKTEMEIEQGLEAHLLISADKEFIDRLAAQGLTDVSSIHAFSETQLALVTASTSNARDLLTRHISFATLLYSTPTLPVFVESALTPAGARSAALMHGHEFSPQLAARATLKPSQEELVEALHAQESLGLMLMVDAVANPDVTVLDVLPESLSAPTLYYVVVLASESMDHARKFGNYLNSKQAKERLKRAGFYLPE